MNPLNARRWLWTALLGACCALVPGCAHTPAAQRDTSTPCPVPLPPPPPSVCVNPPCPRSLCELEQKLMREPCASAKVVFRQSCAKRVAFTVSYGLAAYTFYYSSDTGALLGSSLWNDQNDQIDAGDTTESGCTEECVVCGTPNLPTPRCSDLRV